MKDYNSDDATVAPDAAAAAAAVVKVASLNTTRLLANGQSDLLFSSLV